MGLMGSIFGGVIGLALGGPLGAVAGAVLGHGLGDRAGEKVADTHQRAQAAFFISTFSMLGKMAKADGRVTEEEIQLVRAFMRQQLGLPPQEESYAIEIFRAAKDSDVPFDDFALQFHQIFSRQPDMRRMMLDLLARLAAVDGRVHAAERELLGRAARIFGFPQGELDGILGQYHDDGDQHYAVLGVSSDASMEEIKRAYRRLVVEYHPDKVAARGMPDEFVEYSEARFREIQVAYEKIEARRAA